MRWISGRPSLCAIIPLCVTIWKRLKPRKRMAIVPTVALLSLSLCSVSYCFYLLLWQHLLPSGCEMHSFYNYSGLIWSYHYTHLLKGLHMSCRNTVPHSHTQSYPVSFPRLIICCSTSSITWPVSHTHRPLATVPRCGLSLGRQYTSGFFRCGWTPVSVCDRLLSLSSSSNNKIRLVQNIRT